MTMSPEDAVKYIKNRISIVDLVGRYVHLRANGNRYVAPCPFHQETKPSFSVNAEKGFFYCFGCQASGDIFEFYSKINGLDFKDALAALAEEAGITIEYGKSQKKASGNHAMERSRKQLILKMYDFARRFYTSCLEGAQGEECRRYIVDRGIADETLKTFELGWARRDWRSLADSLASAGFDLELAKEAGLVSQSASGHYFDRFRGRLIFPIKNLAGQTIAFGGRIISGEDEAKYINSADSPIYQKKEHLYGLPNARSAIASKGFAFLTEGYMDVLTLHQFGYQNSVGVLGTALTEEQIKRLSGFTSSIVLLFDGDRAGRKAALRSSELLLARGLSCKVILLPESEDIDSLLRGSGQGRFNALHDEAMDGLEFCVDVLRKLAPREGIEWAKNFLSSVRVLELVSPLLTKLAQMLNISEQVLRQGVSENRPSANTAPNGLIARHNMRDEQIMIYAVRYPHMLDELRKIGADLALSSREARQFWDLLEQWRESEIFHHLDNRQKNFWMRHRHGNETAPLVTCEEEFDSLKDYLSSFYAASQRDSLIAAISENRTKKDYQLEREFLEALRDSASRNQK